VYVYIYIYSTNIPPFMIINRIYEKQKSSVAVACFLPGRAKDLSAPLYKARFKCVFIVAKIVLASVMSVPVSVRSHWTGFSEILYSKPVLKSVEKVEVR